jgi:CHAT domain-containing protein
LLDPKASWNELNGRNLIDNFQSEALLETAVNDWLPITRGVGSDTWDTLFRLATALRQNHKDDWLTDFLTAPFSPVASRLLRSAVKANYSGDPEKAFRDAELARGVFRAHGNAAGALRADLEQIYALRRQSKSDRCVKRALALQSNLRAHRYTWLAIQVGIEVSVCDGMSKHFDQAWLHAQSAVERATLAKYPSLLLRAEALLASWHTLEGRVERSWETNESGLGVFWQEAYTPERGFQFYSDLASAAEEAELWHVAGLLQREAISMLASTHRSDFQAIAQFRLATEMQMSGSLAEARESFERAASLFRRLPPGAATGFYKAYCELGLATIELRLGFLDTAIEHLSSSDVNGSRINNFAVQLPYEKTWAEIERRRLDSRGEEKHLENAVTIGSQGFRSLASEQQRWEWRREVGQAYRRLLEIRIDRIHDPEDSWVRWELYHAQESSGAVSRGRQLTQVQAKRHLRSQNRRAGNLFSIIFSVLPHEVIAWTVYQGKVSQHRLGATPDYLKNQVNSFFHLCSDPSSSLKKVKESGSRLYGLLMEPLGKEIDDQATVYIEADEFLGRIPWSALVAKDGRYMGETHTLILSPGPLHRHRSHEPITKMTAPVVAYPGAIQGSGRAAFPSLPEAEGEINLISRLFPGTTTLRADDVTIARVRRELRRASLFHFAGHAITRQFGGELVVHGQMGADFFSSSSLSNLDLGATRLVVLSACSTTGSDNDDPHGLVRAFLSARANGVIATQWNISSSSTSLLMNHFYRSFSKTRDAATSLKKAGDDLRSQYRFAHPYYWAAFELFQQPIE